ncbi:MAG: hypothetical protein PHV56_01785 [Clostridia bacterium]|nr:hypothetical protein [Clostridia bacterium]
MLYCVDSGKYIKTIPHQKEFNAWMKNLSSADYLAIVNELNICIDGSDVNTSSWMPGNDWTGTVFEPIYHACDDNVEISGMFFGLILFKIMIEHFDVWGFGRYEKDGVPIKGMTYFKLHYTP